MSFSFGAVKSNQNAQPTGTNLSFGVATPSSAFSGGFGGGGVSFGGQSNFFTNTTSASPSSTSSTSMAPIVSSNNQPSFSNPATAQINVNTGMECCLIMIDNLPLLLDYFQGYLAGALLSPRVRRKVRPIRLIAFTKI